MLKAVIFDMDGVILNSEPEHYKVEHLFFEDLGIDKKMIYYEDYVGLSSRKMWTEIRDKFHLNWSVDDLVAESTRRIMAHFEKIEIKAMEGLEDFLDFLKNENMLMAVASSSPKCLIDLIIGRLGIGHYFEVLVSGDEVNRGKPHADIYYRTAELLGVSRKTCIVIEDSANGVQAALRAGMRCIGFFNIGSGNQNLSMCETVVRSYDGLGLKLLKDHIW